MVRAKGSGIAEIYSGLGSIVLFGGLFLLTHAEFFLFIGAFTGVLPLIRGASRVTQARVNRREQARVADQNRESGERVVLRLAKAERGRLTPALVTVNSHLSLEEAERQLNFFVDKGYAQLEVTDDGRLEYRFPEFLPRDEHPLLP